MEFNTVTKRDGEGGEVRQHKVKSSLVKSSQVEAL